MPVRGLFAAAALAAPSNPPLENVSTPLHPVEAYCIDYKTDGPFSQTGWLKVCSRKFGAEVASTTYFEGEGGNTKTGEKWATVCHSQTILVGEKQYVFDLNGKKGALGKDASYPLRRSAAQAYFEQKSAADYLRVFGFTPTGAVGEVENLACDEYEIAGESERACYTKDLLLLRTEQTGMGKFTMVATKIAVGSGGEDEQYRLFETLPYQVLRGNGRFFYPCVRKDEIEKKSVE